MGDPCLECDKQTAMRLRNLGRCRNHTSARDRDRCVRGLSYSLLASLVMNLLFSGAWTKDAFLVSVGRPCRWVGGGLGGRGDNGQKKLLPVNYETEIA